MAALAHQLLSQVTFELDLSSAYETEMSRLNELKLSNHVFGSTSANSGEILVELQDLYDS